MKAQIGIGGGAARRIIRMNEAQTTPLTPLIDAAYDTIEARTRRSWELHERAYEVMANGTPTALQFHAPYPIVMQRSVGSRVFDVDGNEYIDFHNAYSVGVMGHCHPAIVRAITEQVARLDISGFVCSTSIDLAEAICSRFGGGGLVQFTTSGTEATMLAIRMARAWTGRPQVIKIEGGYHGAHDAVMVGTHGGGIPTVEGEDEGLPWGRGLAPHSVSSTLVCGFNDANALAGVLERHAGDIACVILEPVMLNVGFIEPEPGYLERVAALCHEHGALLIWDEVKTGVTIAHGGCAQAYDIGPESLPDLRCLGKGIGGGMPCGAVHGRAELFSVIEDGTAPHYSTFAGHPATMAAGLACLTEVLTAEAYEQMSALNERLMDGITILLKQYELPGHTVGIGAKGTVLFTEHEKLLSYRAWSEGIDRDLGGLYWASLLSQGILLSPGQDEQWTLSVAHTEQDIDQFLAAFEVFAAAAHASRTN